MAMKRPRRNPRRAAALALALLPFLVLCFSVGLWDRVHPLILGLPFNLAWLLAGAVMTSLCLAATLRLDPPESTDDDPHDLE